MHMTPIAVLPNLTLQEPIECSRFALVPPTHDAVTAYRRKYRGFDTFMDRFTDTFGAPIEPTVLLRRGPDRPQKYDRGGAVAFRDAVAVAAVTYDRATYVIYNSSRGTHYSDSFWIYPWTLWGDKRNIIATTPALHALHRPEKLHGQCSPEISLSELQSGYWDTTLLNALCEAWHERYVTSKPSWRTRALFRSLNMANQAMRIPAGVDATLYDHGRLTALWVSAFEILVRSPEEKSNEKAVRALLSNVKWDRAELGYRRYLIKYGKTKKKVTLAGWLYHRLYKLRNDFLHGNPVTARSLAVSPKAVSFITIAAPLYRLALTSFLDLEWNKPVPSTDDVSAFAEYVNDRTWHRRSQRLAEDALLLARMNRGNGKGSNLRVERERLQKRRRHSGPTLPAR